MDQEIKLTQFSKGAGCGCKIAPKDLHEILAGNYDQQQFEKLLVGNQSHDDAAVYDIGNNTCLISTTDFFSPIVDDAFAYGQIAAANALSDVYAMGGKPIMALAVLGWPIGKIPNSIAQQVLAGAREICQLVHIPLAGGHSIDSPEPFFGLSVNGLVQAPNIKTNNKAKAGDVIYITKPIGSGLLTTALKKNKLTPSQSTQLLKQLTHVNVEGADFGSLDYVHAMTDITGFGLLGHLNEICAGSHVSAQLEYEKIPLLEGCNDLAKAFIYPDNTMRNYQAVLPHSKGLNGSNLFTLCDPQTNGGLMVSIQAGDSKKFESFCSERQFSFHEIGKIIPQEDHQIIIL